MSLNFLEGLSASISPSPWESKKVLLDQVNNKHFIHFVCLFKKNNCGCNFKSAFPAVWSDDDWLKKFSGKTVEEAEAEAAAGETPQTTAQEVRGFHF